jgi:hypothetical protein
MDQAANPSVEFLQRIKTAYKVGVEKQLEFQIHAGAPEISLGSCSAIIIDRLIVFLVPFIIYPFIQAFIHRHVLVHLGK